ncbi:protein of unknown function DUF554 [Thalassoporum mexicanum PCC 7367]|uniref:DUF554 domain-containing protein n=1 Tax=Thalassoporum mexicanum TaxID=3457544 RepID=UPI00029F8F05|nr:DUF554 domain-containing protein [Pseudanabaena sp. PCC 7367]AFY70804.1 protein of unknown function DUF554 [Pseudanabaena sp. PCC 7367]
MALSFWAKTSGTWINILTVLIGTGTGLLLHRRLPDRLLKILTQGIGLLTIWIGVSMAGSLNQAQAGQLPGAIAGLLSITIGGVLGEWWQLEQKLTAIGDWLKFKFKGKGKFTEGFVAASLLFCIGPMTLIGSLNNGLTGDNALLTLKATMDGIAAIALTGSYGIGVGFSTLVIMVFQGGVSLAAGLLSSSIADPATNPAIALLTGVGGLMILGIGINLLGIGAIAVASFLPALVVAPLIFWLASWFG